MEWKYNSEENETCSKLAQEERKSESPPPIVETIDNKEQKGALKETTFLQRV